MEIPYGRYDEAYKAIHSALSTIGAPSSGKKITRLVFSWNADATLNTVEAYDGEELCFTLSFTWNSNRVLKQVARS